MSTQPQQRWIIAQETPGVAAYVWWSVVDTATKGIRVRALGERMAQDIADGLNGVPLEARLGVDVDPEIAQALYDEIVLSAERECGHQNTGDGSAVTTCATCMCWAQAQQDAEAVRKHLGMA